MWIKYRGNFADSIGEWEYMDFENDVNISNEDIIENLDFIYQHRSMDKFVGYEFEKIDMPPKEVLEQKIHALKVQALYYSHKYFEKLALLTNVDEVSKYDSLIDNCIERAVHFANLPPSGCVDHYAAYDNVHDMIKATIQVAILYEKTKPH